MQPSIDRQSQSEPMGHRKSPQYARREPQSTFTGVDYSVRLAPTTVLLYYFCLYLWLQIREGHFVCYES